MFVGDPALDLWGARDYHTLPDHKERWLTDRSALDGIRDTVPLQRWGALPKSYGGLGVMQNRTPSLLEL